MHKNRLTVVSFLLHSDQIEEAKKLNTTPSKSKHKIHFQGSINKYIAVGCSNSTNYATLKSDKIEKITCSNCLRFLKSTAMKTEIRIHPKTGKLLCRFAESTK